MYFAEINENNFCFHVTETELPQSEKVIPTEEFVLGMIYDPETGTFSDLKGVDSCDIRKTEKADYKWFIRKRGYDEQIRRIPHGEPHHRGAVSGAGGNDGVML